MDSSNLRARLGRHCAAELGRGWAGLTIYGELVGGWKYSYRAVVVGVGIVVLLDYVCRVRQDAKHHCCIVKPLMPVCRDLPCRSSHSTSAAIESKLRGGGSLTRIHSECQGRSRRTAAAYCWDVVMAHAPTQTATVLSIELAAAAVVVAVAGQGEEEEA